MERKLIGVTILRFCRFILAFSYSSSATPSYSNYPNKIAKNKFRSIKFPRMMRATKYTVDTYPTDLIASKYTNYQSSPTSMIKIVKKAWAKSSKLTRGDYPFEFTFPLSSILILWANSSIPSNVKMIINNNSKIEK